MSRSQYQLSPLDIDVAISKLSVAAARLHLSIGPTEEDRRLAEDLRAYLAKDLESRSSDETVPEDVVADAAARQLLERSIASLSNAHARFRSADAAALSRLVQQLDLLVDESRSFTRDEASEFLHDLHELTHRRRELAKKLAELPKP